MASIHQKTEKDDGNKRLFKVFKKGIYFCLSFLSLHSCPNTRLMKHSPFSDTHREIQQMHNMNPSSHALFSTFRISTTCLVSEFTVHDVSTHGPRCYSLCARCVHASRRERAGMRMVAKRTSGCSSGKRSRFGMLAALRRVRLSPVACSLSRRVGGSVTARRMI